MALITSLFMRNPISIRRVTKAALLISFFLCALLLVFTCGFDLSIFNISLGFSKFSLSLGLILSFCFIVFSYLSKPLINKSHKLFYSLALAYYFIINFFIFSNNLTVLILLLFWIYFITYLLNYNFSYSKEAKNSLALNLSIDFITLLIAGSLIGFNFLRYFLVNNIEFTFQNIVINAPSITDSSIVLAFFGVLLIVFNLAKFLPFDGSNLNNQNKINPLCSSICAIGSFFLSGAFLIKSYYSFDWLFFNYQNLIAYYVLFNIFYYAILIYKQNSTIKFSFLVTKVTFGIGVLSLFTFSESIFGVYFYYLISSIVSLLTLFSLGLILFSKFKTDKISRFITSITKNKLLSFFIFIALLNIAKVPILPMFSATLTVLALLFSLQYETLVMDFVPYFAFLALVILSFNIYDFIRSIFIEANKKTDKNYSYSILNHQIIIMVSLLFSLILVGIFPDYFIDTFLKIGTSGL